MDWLSLLGTAMALAMDAFAVATAVAASLEPIRPRQTFRLTWHFGLFQALMPVIGWLGGSAVASYVSPIDHWVAFGLLGFLGTRMFIESLSEGKPQERHDPTRGWSLVWLSVATSIDALAVGVSLGVLNVRIWIPAAVIGVVALALTFVGTLVGRFIGAHLGRWAARIGGVVLVAVGTRILIRDLLA
jgi:putative Mn2+ efflux pump MntP